MIDYRKMIDTLHHRTISVFEHSEPLIPALGAFCVIWQIVCYFIWGYLIPQPYENLPLRIIQAAMALPFVFYMRLKGSLPGFYPPYYLFFILLSSPFFFFFMTMKNGWSEVWAMSTLCGLLVIIPFVYDWLLIGILLTLAYGLAHLTVTMLDGGVSYTHMQWAYLPIFVFGITGSLIGTRWTHFRHATKLSLMKSLSGTIAHEMRSPLNTITLAIDAIKAMLPEQREADSGNDGSVTIPSAALSGIRDIIDQGDETIRRSNKIIDSILASLNGSEIDRRQFKRLAAAQTVIAAIENFGFGAPEDRILVHTDVSRDFDFLGDRDLLTHTLFNLLGNALYYRSKPGFRIDINLETDQHGNRIIIRDKGPGVPVDKREAIFDQFYTYGKSGGNGLGLSFCRRVAESFGGSIVCRSTLGEWTEFVINLPSYDSNGVEVIKREMLAEKLILVVDDQAPNRIMLCKYLNEMNCRPDQAENGKVALDMAAKNRYDLILMDIEMPVLNGDEAVRQLRAGKEIEPSMALHYKEIPIIGITALPENQAIRRTLHSGMNDYILKPIGRAQVKELVESSFFTEKLKGDEMPMTGVPGASILLVDDNIMTREFLKALLEPLGYRIFQAEDGMATIEILRQSPIDLIIMDLEMPVMGGIETTKAIRNGNAGRFREVPIISLSGYTDEESVAAAKESGINVHLGKPVRKLELVNVISTLLTQTLRNGQSDTDDDLAANSPWLEMEKIPLMDQSIIESLQGLGDDDFLKQLFNLFVQDAGRLVGEMEKACRQNDHDNAQRTSHTLKGSAASIGAARIEAVAASMNDSLRNLKYPDEGWMAYLRQVYELTSEIFSNYAGPEQQTMVTPPV